MRFRLLIPLSLFFIAFLAVTALSADWENQESLSADELISGVEKNPRTITTPQQARALRENESEMDWSMPSTLSEGARDPKTSRAEAEAAIGEEDDETVDEADNTSDEEAASVQTTELPPAAVSLPSLGGSWSFMLNDSMQRVAALTLFQNSSEIFGAGKVRVENSTVDATVSGQAYQNGTAKLDITTLSPINLYSLNLRLDGDNAVGDYKATSASQESWTGTVEGVKTA